MLFRALPFVLLTLVVPMVFAASPAAPTHPFPAVRRLSAEWWRNAPSMGLPLGGAPAMGRLSLAWDDESLYLRIQEAVARGTVALQFPTGERRAVWKDGAGGARNVAGKDLPGVVTVRNGAVDVAVRWTDLGYTELTARKAIPLNVGWSTNGRALKWRPSGALAFNQLTWGVFFLNDTVPLDRCAPTLTRPFRHRFAPAHGTPSLIIEREPEAGLCLPVEARFRSIGATDAWLSTRRTPGGPVRLELPAQPDSVVVGVSFRPTMYDPGSEIEYRALPPGEDLFVHKSSPGWRRPADWDDYWKRARADLDRVPMNARIREAPEGASATGRLYRVEMDSLGGVGLVCWYFVPRAVDVLGGPPRRRYPAVQIMPGYGAEEPPIDRTADGFITLSVNPRGHGPSNALWPLPPDHLTWNITDPENYYYRGAYMDCVRAVQFLLGRPEVDAKHVAVEGSSQGGAFALARAALEPRVAACSANVPFLCDFPTAVKLSTRGGLAGLRARFENAGADGRAVRKTMGYIDASFMAAAIRCPTIVSVGEMDRTCPPESGVAAYHQLKPTVKKRLLVTPNRDHEVMPEWLAATRTWYRQWLQGKEPAR